MPSATDWRTWDNEHVWHPFCPMQEYRNEAAPTIVSGNGFFLTDAEGREYLDGNSSLWCNVHGHRVPEIDAALRDQLDRIAHSTLLGLSSPPAAELAHQLVRRSPESLTKVFYSDSGATSVEVALKLAYQFHLQRRDRPARRRDLFISLSQAYHGDTVGSVSVGGIQLFHGLYGGLLFETVQVPAPVALRVPAGHTPQSYLAWCQKELERVIREYADRAVAFVIEPLVQGAAGILVHPPGYLRRVRQLTREYDIPLIADEVAVGFGRTGTLFACEQEQVEPDFLCLAKGISGGYLPLAATLTTERIYDAFLGAPSDGRTFFHGHTYTGNALACAAALASLELFERNALLESLPAKIGRLATRLSELNDHPHVAEIRQCGLMAGIELVADRPSLTAFPAESRVGHRVTLAARRHGLITRPLGDTLIVMPAPGMPIKLIDTLCDRLFAALADALAEIV